LLFISNCIEFQQHGNVLFSKLIHLILYLGLYWGSSVKFDFTIHENGVWLPVQNVSVNFNLKEPRNVLITYHIIVQGLPTSSLRSPLPRENVKDSLQMRCIVDGIPYRYSSSYTSSYLVEKSRRLLYQVYLSWIWVPDFMT